MGAVAMEILKEAKYQRLLIVFALLAVVLSCYFLGPKMGPNIPEPIVPPQAEEVIPAAAGPLDYSAAAARIWTTDIYVVPDMTPEEVVTFYRRRLFHCELVTYELYYPQLDEVYWSCGRGIRAAQGFSVGISNDPLGKHDGSNIVITVSIYPWY
jgi:hypothetical protein